MERVIIPTNVSNSINPILSSSTTLYLGSLQAASNPLLLKQYKITAVLTVASDIELKLPPGIASKVIAVEDNVFQNLAQHFSQTGQFISKHLQKGNVLVHCRAGISRSATVVIAFLMRYKLYKLKRATQLVRQARHIIKPNEGFMVQLKEYQRKLKKTLEAKGAKLK